MLMIRSLDELKKYLEVRSQMAKNQIHATSSNQFENGMVYAFGEAVKAVEVMIHLDKSNESTESPAESQIKKGAQLPFSKAVTEWLENLPEKK